MGILDMVGGMVTKTLAASQLQARNDRLSDKDDLSSVIENLGEDILQNYLRDNSSSETVESLLSDLRSGGLGSAVTSWLSSGENQKVTAEQIMKVLDKKQVQNIAGSLGVEPDQAAELISGWLPKIVDKLPKDRQTD